MQIQVIVCSQMQQSENTKNRSTVHCWFDTQAQSCLMMTHSTTFKMGFQLTLDFLLFTPGNITWQEHKEMCVFKYIQSYSATVFFESFHCLLKIPDILLLYYLLQIVLSKPFMFEFLDEYFDRVHTNLVRCLHCFGNKKSSPVHHSHSPVFFQNTISRLVPAKLVGLRMIHPNIFVHGDFQNSKMDLHYISNSISFSSNGK